MRLSWYTDTRGGGNAGSANAPVAIAITAGMPAFSQQMVVPHTGQKRNVIRLPSSPTRTKLVVRPSIFTSSTRNHAPTPNALPVLVDGDLVVTESVAIALYLAEKYLDKRLMPTELSERAQAFRWLFFVVTELEQPLWRMARHAFLYPEADRSKAEIALAARDFLDMARVFEAHMKGRPFVVGDRVSIVDFVTAFTLDWANGENLLGDLPALTRYLGRMYERPRAAPRIAERQAS